MGVEARTSAARSQSGVSCSWPTAETTGTGQAANARTTVSSLKGSRSSKLPPPRVTMTTSTSGMGRDATERVGDAPARARALDARLGDDDVSRGEAGADAGDDVALRRGVRARDDADGPREPRQGALALGREQPLGRQDALEALDRGEVVAESDPLDRGRRGS